ncbi:MAG: A24 family peptidase, partial [Clostridium sp.]
YGVLTLFLIVIALIDYDTTDVYSCVVYPGVAIGIIFVILERIIYSGSLVNYVAAVGIGLFIIGGIYLLTGGFGAGDIEIAVLCGVFLGWKLEIYFILISFIIGGAIGITLIAMKKKSKTDYMPLGPSLAIGAYIALLMGETVIMRLIGLS